MKQTKATEYMYASARLRALERHMVGRERLEVLMECRTSDEVMARLAEYGIAPAEDTAAPLGEARSAAREGMLLAILRDAYAEVEAAVPNPAPYRAYRYPYDCNNLKVAVKCAIRGIPAGDMLFDFGTVPADRVETVLREGRELSLFPPAMAAAVSVAQKAYEATGDPCRIDAVLDRACYEDMMATLSEAEDPTLLSWLRAKIDLVNILTCLRILRMKRGDAGAAFLAEALLPGGTMDGHFFEAAYVGGESALWSALIPTPYTALTRFEGEAPTLRWAETTADNLWMALVRDGARVPFGAPVAGGYLIGCETAVKNLRILLAAKDAGLSQEALRERIRLSYV